LVACHEVFYLKKWSKDHDYLGNSWYNDKHIAVGFVVKGG